MFFVRPLSGSVYGSYRLEQAFDSLTLDSRKCYFDLNPIVRRYEAVCRALCTCTPLIETNMAGVVVN